MTAVLLDSLITSSMPNVSISGWAWVAEVRSSSERHSMNSQTSALGCMFDPILYRSQADMKLAQSAGLQHVFMVGRRPSGGGGVARRATILQVTNGVY